MRGTCSAGYPKVGCGKIEERRNPSAVPVESHWGEEAAIQGLLIGWAIGYRPSLVGA